VKPTKKEKRMKDSKEEALYKDLMQTCVNHGFLEEDWTHFSV
jgi:hypothetical protein